MKIDLRHSALEAVATPCLILPLAEAKTLPAPFKPFDKLLDGRLAALLSSKEFSGKAGDTLLLHAPAGSPWQRLLLVGLGGSKQPARERLRQATSLALSSLKGRRILRAALPLDALPLKGLSLADRVAVAAEAAELCTYRFDRYRTTQKKDSAKAFEKLTLILPHAKDVSAAKPGLDQGLAIAAGVALARDLVNEPGNIKSPEFLAAAARNLACDAVRCTVLEEKALQQEGMGALLGVAQGSVRPPRLIVLQYQGTHEEVRPIALVGKGVVFDAGGISLKPAEKMDEMKMDMGGAAAVLGTFLAASRLKLPINLLGVIPAVENLPSGNAIRPGDILTSLSGKTIEVLNTDAEGRLILADALCYAQRYNPRVIIDVATRTGACIIALGHHAPAVLGHHDGLIRQLIKAGEQCGERLWQLPLWDDYAQQINSEVADIKNIGGRPAGTVTAAAFLQKFVEIDAWAHIDIAGTAWEEKGKPGTPKGGTGVGVRLLVQYLLGL